ncbi:hypothetical protein EDB92DRAFT_1640219 [Lactarius akahatsu]|uniref:Uncharacterized protein n=1 Tax=Lactarius akahatsu TaxID=416441 RepID=A0AAD4L6P5_9AGAM|nr:hypothetical protein EDB92DRAFT_1640219 [Lactarius akahatsu]
MSPARKPLLSASSKPRALPSPLISFIGLTARNCNLLLHPGRDGDFVERLFFFVWIFAGSVGGQKQLSLREPRTFLFVSRLFLSDAPPRSAVPLESFPCRLEKCRNYRSLARSQALARFLQETLFFSCRPSVECQYGSVRSRVLSSIKNATS